MQLSRLYVIILLLLGHTALGQQLKLGANPYVLNKSAVLELSSDNQGLLLPRIADTSLINAFSPPDGMVIFFTTNKQFLVRANGYWNPLPNEAALGNYWSTSGNSNNALRRVGTIDNFDLPFITNNVERLRILSSGNIGIGIAAPTAGLHLRAGTASAGSAPLKLTSGTLMSTAEVGAIEFLTDKFYGTISTGTSRKEFTLNDAALTSGRLPFATTNGRLTNASNLYYSSSRFGVYQSSPTAFLHLGAGLATTSNAPLKFTTGALLSTLENGAVEYDGVHIYITIGGVRYQLDQQPGTTYTGSNGITLSGTDFRNNLITGVAGGQTVTGGTNSGNALTLSSTLHATKGKILFGNSGYDEAANRLGVGNNAPTEALDITGNLKFSGALMPNNNAGTNGHVLQSNGAGAAPSWLNLSTSMNNAISSTAWLQDGNSTLDLKSFGTTTNVALPFITNNVERMRLTSAGWLGMGTNNPSSLLHLVGTNPLTLSGVQNGTATTADSVLTINSGTVQKLPVSTFATASNSWAATGNSGLNSGTNFLGTTNNVSLRFRTNNTERFVIDSNGRVGIANATPAERLDITGNLRLSGAFMPAGSAGTAGFVLQSNGAGNAPSWVDGTTYINSSTWLQGGSNVTALRNLGTTSNFALPFITNNVERMRLTTGGMLGIGTTAPSSLLHIMGANPLTLSGVQTGTNTSADSVLTISGGLVQKLPASTFQSQLNGNGFVKASGSNITYDNNNYTVANAPITGATRTKITYDSKGLVTAGTDATTSDIAEAANLYFTEARVRSTALTGLSTATATAVAATDNLLTGVGKLQGQINAINSAGYLTGNQNITLTGDVTGSGTTAITTSIGANRVTLGNMAQVATGTFLGRTTAGTGNVEALTTAQVRSMLNLSGTNSGDVSLAGQNYLSLSGQTITANAVDLSGTHVTGTLAAPRFGALSGDVTSPGGSYATTIANGAVTYGKMQNVSTNNRLLGRATSGAGTVEEITIGTGLTLTGTTLSANSANQWNLSGNSATSWSSNFLGTTDNVSLRFRTSNTQRMMIDSLGRIGIGITNPANPLVVKDTMEIRRVGSLSTLLFTNTSGSGDFRIAGDGGDIFWQGGGGRSLQMGSFWGMTLSGDRQTTAFPAFSGGTGGIGVLIPASRTASIPLVVQGMASQTANLTEWRNSANTGLLAITNAGNLGIGTTAPSTRLHIVGTNPVTLTGVQAGGTTTADSVLTINNGTVQKLPVSTFGMSTNAWSTTGNSSVNWSTNFLGTSANASLRIRTNNVQRLIIDSVGNVGIGTTTFDTDSPERLRIDAGTGTYTPLFATGNYDGYLQINIKNTSTGTAASSDLVATADNGTETTNFINLGINGSNYTYTPGSPIETGKANDGYLISSGQDLYIVNNNPTKNIVFLTGGTAATNEAMRITPNDQVGIGTTNPSEKLHVVRSTGSGAATANVMMVETVNATTSATSNPPNITLVRQLPSFAANTTYAGPLLTYGYRTNGTVNNLVQLQAMSNPATSRLAFFTRTGMTTSNPATGTLAENMWLDGTTLAVRGLTGNNTQGLSADANGNIIRTPSDGRLKTNVATIDSPLEKIRKMRGVTYNWIDTARYGRRKEIGFIAQELELVVPEVVTEGGEYKSVNYQVLNALLTEAVKEQQKMIEEMKNDINTLKAELEELKKATGKNQKTAKN